MNDRTHELIIAVKEMIEIQLEKKEAKEGVR